MDQYSQKTYLVTLSHLRSWKTADKNDLLIQLKANNLSLSEFYHFDNDTLTNEFNLSEKQILSLKNSEKLTIDTTPNKTNHDSLLIKRQFRRMAIKTIEVIILFFNSLFI